MSVQWAGLILAFITVATIGIGHVTVRKLNYFYGTKPAPYALILGLALLLLSLVVRSNLASASLGILGITTLWDSLEFIRQEERIRRGHAPANPNRPVEAPRR